MDQRTSGEKEQQVVQPLVSVVITTFNRPEILRDRALTSILGQTYRNIECIIVDDYEAKNSAEPMVREVMAGDPRVRYMKAYGKGTPSPCRNAGLRECRGQFICGIDDDDEWEPTFIEDTLQEMSKISEDYGAVATGLYVIDENGRSYYTEQPVDQWWALSIGCGFLFRRELFFEKGVHYDENLITFEDVDLSIQIHQAGYKVWMLHKPLRSYHLPPLNPKTGRASLSNPSPRLAKSFAAFYDKDHHFHEEVGPQALEWLYLSGGFTLCRGGMMKEGRQFFWKAFRARPSAYTLFFATLSIVPFPFFTAGIRTKDRFMRFFRWAVINRRVPASAVDAPAATNTR